MKFEEIIPALKDGKKVRIKYWYKDKYIYINSNGNIEDQDGDHCEIVLDRLCDLEADQWEIVE